MPSRERTAAQQSLPPDERRSSSGDGWMLEVTVNLEQLNSRMGAVEKSLDGVAAEVRKSTGDLAAEVRTAAEISKVAVEALTRIAKAEEERAGAESDRNKILLKDNEVRERWAERIWSSPAFQVLLSGVVLGVLQFLGVTYVVSQLPPGVIYAKP